MIMHWRILDAGQPERATTPAEASRLSHDAFIFPQLGHRPIRSTLGRRSNDHYSGIILGEAISAGPGWWVIGDEVRFWILDIHVVGTKDEKCKDFALQVIDFYRPEPRKRVSSDDAGGGRYAVESDSAGYGLEFRLDIARQHCDACRIDPHSRQPAAQDLTDQGIRAGRPKIRATR
jgi:hypothetical protein